MRKFDLEKDKLLILLLAGDLVFLLLHILHVFTLLLPVTYFSLSRDRSYAEFFQYTKEFWIAILLLILCLRQRKLIYLAFALLFLYFLIDDSFEVHEKFGLVMADLFGFQAWFGLRPLDWGELLVSAIFGGAILAGIATAYFASDVHHRRFAMVMLAMLAALAFFGILMDMLEILAQVRWLSETIKMIEESGEMLVMSVITWFVYSLRLQPTEDPLAVFTSESS